MFQPSNDWDQTEVNKPTTDNDLQHTRPSTPTEEIAIPPELPSQIHSPSTRTGSPTFHSPINNYSESPKHLLSSPTQPGNSQQTIRRSRSRSRTRGPVRSNSKSRSTSQNRSRSATRHKSQNLHVQSPPPSPQEQPKGNYKFLL
jgi:hypothetical protein